MKKNLMFWIFIMLLLFVILPFVFAESSFMFKLDRIIDLKISCFDINNSLCLNTTTCQMTINNPNSTNLIKNQEMTFNDNFFNYTLSSAQNQNLGEHYVTTTCQGSTNGFSTFVYEVTPSGTEPSTAQGLMYVVLIVVAIFLLCLSAFGCYSLNTNNQFDFGGQLIKINLNKYLKFGLFYLSYILLIILVFFIRQVTENFLFLSFTANLFRVIFLFLVIMFFPLFLIGLVLMFLRFLLLDYELLKLKKRGLTKR